MLGMIIGPEYQPAAPKLFPYRVTCDRAFNRRIEQAAKKAGVTPGQFVQAHFEALFDREDAALQGSISALRRASATIDPVAFSREHGISLMAARAWAWLASRADDNRLVTATLRDIATAAGAESPHSGSRLREQLLDARLISDVRRNSGLAGSTYRICEVS